MFKKRFFHVFVSLILIVTTLCCSTVTSLAYYPVVQIKSSDWTIFSPGTYSAVYPEMIDKNYAPLDKCYSYSNLNGATYFGSRNWEEGYPSVKNVSFKFDPKPGFSQNVDRFRFVFRSGDAVYCFYIGSDVAGQVWIEYSCDASGNPYNFNFTYEADNSFVTLLQMTYPFTESVVVAQGNIASKNSDGTYTYSNSLFYNNVIPIWSSSDVYSAENGLRSDIVFNHAEGNNILDFCANTLISFDLIVPLDVICGTMRFELTAQQMEFLNIGACCMRIDDIGVIAGAYLEFFSAYYYMYIYDSDDNLLGRKQFAQVHNDSDLNAGESYFTDLVSFGSFDIGNSIDLSEYKIELIFVFILDYQHLVFPGTFEIIEFESYEEDQEHDEVLNAIGNATDVVSGAINSASSELSAEIVKAVDDISSSVNSSKVAIVDAVDGGVEDIVDGLDDIYNNIDDMGDKITDKLEDTKNGILDGIKSFFVPTEEEMVAIKDEWDKLLKTRFGALYEVSDIVTEFGGSLNMDYINSNGVKNTITMPSVTVDLAGTPFTFGGYEVQIVPDGFDVLIIALKGITSIVCTFCFVNALRRKYDKLVGGNSV